MEIEPEDLAGALRCGYAFCDEDADEIVAAVKKVKALELQIEEMRKVIVEAHLDDFGTGILCTCKYCAEKTVDGRQMKAPLQALLIAGKLMRDSVLEGRKKITIREGHRDYVVGKPVILCCHLLNWATMRQVTKVRHTTLGEVTPEELIADGFMDWADMERGMKQFYPTIGQDSPVTVISWE